MNFLSHFYFDRYTSDPDRVLGMVLPDLVKNARKEWCFRPEKHQEKFSGSKAMENLLTGWKRHLLVDKHFHSSAFFCHHTQLIKASISEILVNSPARPSFVAHIALELMLDALLLTDSVIDAEDFYDRIAAADRQELKRFFELNNVSDVQPFFNFLDEFIESSYLNSYRDAQNIMYALSRICMRLWAEPFNETQKLQLTASLVDYQFSLKNEYISIFYEIDSVLNGD